MKEIEKELKIVMDFLKKNHHPHIKIVINSTTSELVEGLETIQST